MPWRARLDRAVVALVLGWAVAGEELVPGALPPIATVVVAVVLIVLGERARSAVPPGGLP